MAKSKIWNRVEFKGSFTELEQLPEDSFLELSFVGRSNVGKSSLINALTGRKKLAKVSGTPGKTRTINYYLVEEAFYLVDLPGYGYAKGGQIGPQGLQKYDLRLHLSAAKHDLHLCAIGFKD